MLFQVVNIILSFVCNLIPAFRFKITTTMHTATKLSVALVSRVLKHMITFKPMKTPTDQSN